MKEVIAIIRMEKVNLLKQALVDAGFPAFTVRKVIGRGQGTVDPRVMQGAVEGSPEAIARLKDDGPMLIPNRMMLFAVQDENVARLVETIIKICKSGKNGDGKIFVKPLEDVVRIRTSEHGSAAVA